MKHIDKVNNFWKDGNIGAMLKDAFSLAQEQRETNKRYSKEEQNRYYDRSLTDVRRFKRKGQFITIHHLNLLTKAIAGEYTCPVLSISSKTLDAVQRVKQATARQIIMSNHEAQKKPSKPFNLMDIGEAKRVFAFDYLMPLFKARDIDYVFDSDNKTILHDLVSYFTRQNDCNLDLSKGICLYGGVGTGKTSIMRALSNFTNDFNLITAFDFVYMADVESDCSTNGLDVLDKYKNRTCFFDDIGKRLEGVNNYGTKIDPYSELVTRQYNRYIRKNASLSHYSTNIEFKHSDEIGQALAAKFGVREIDRFNEMVNFVYLGGGSRRNY